MKSKVKQILSVIMTICMLSTMIPLTAYGADVDFDDDATVTAEVSEDTETDADIEVDEDTSTDDADVTVEEDEEEQIAESEEDEFTSDDAEEVFSDDESVVDVGDTLDGYNYSIVMVDCGRNYYSVESLESIINSASEAGMHYVMLALGNDGLRFLLKDMSLTVGTQKYSSYAVTKAIHEGNEKYRNFDVDELTERDMETILSYAGSKGVEIIPLINTPGHMDSILNAATSLTGVNCAYSSSARTIDVTNDTATAFTQALLQKYISWFASKGCTMFNMGADEYANDTGNPRFSELISSGAYSSYITYLNTVAGMIENARMKPMAFNDGIYYNEQTEYGKIDKNIFVCYWSSGWNGYDVAPASWLSEQGFNMINTHGDWYWIVGGSKVTADKAKQFDVKSFQESMVANPSGAMFCIWSDYEFSRDSNNSDAAVANAVSDIISDFGSTLPDTSIREAHKNVSVSDEVKPEIAFNGTLENAGDTSVLSMTDNTEVCWTTSNKNVIMLTENAGETAVSTNTLTDSVIGNSVTAMVVGSGKATVTAETATGIQHTQEFTVNDGGNSEDTENNEIKLEVGKKTTRVQAGVNNAGNVDNTEYDSGIAKVTVAGTDEIEGKTDYSSTSVAIGTLAGSNTSWTKTDYFYQSGNNYYPVYAYKDSIEWNYYYGYSATDSSEAVTIIDSSWFSTTSVTVYEQSTTDPTPASTTITFEGLMPGTTYYTVGDTEYTIIVSPKEVTENKNLYFNQKEKINVDIPEGGSVSYEVTSGDSVSVSDDGTVTAGTTKGTATVVATVTNANGNTYAVYIYEYNVIAEDLSQVTPLEIEYWITNAQVIPDAKAGVEILSKNSTNAENKSYTYNYSELLAEKVYEENGIEIKSLISPSGKHGDNPVIYWKTRVLTGTKQDNSEGNDRTLENDNADDVQYIRYFDQKWSYSGDRKTWEDISDNAQIVAYYLQKTEVTQAISTLVKDWGLTKDNNESWFDWENSWALSFAAVYDTGMEPSEGNLINTTTFYNGDANRNIGYLKFVNTDDYEVYKVTATYGERTASNSRKSVSYNLSTNETETIVWQAGDSEEAYINGAEHPESCVWGDSGSAILIRIYVREKVKTNTLKVVYKLTDGTEFYNLNINTKEENDFTGYVSDGKLIKTEIENAVGNVQVLTTDLKDTVNLPNMPSKYKSGNYSFERAEVSSDNKTLYLVYTGKNAKTLVYDFGLGIKVEASNLVDNAEEVKKISWKDEENCTVTSGSNEKEIIVQINDATVQGADLTVTVTYENDSSEYDLFLIPASTVYYEEGFAETDGGFSGASKGISSQNTAILGEDTNNYGYDGAYASATTASNNTEASSKAKGDKATFTFTGTGVDIYANTTTDTGSLTIKIADSSTNATQQLAIVDTKMFGNQIQDVTSGYNVPVFSVTDLTHGTYTVTITHSMNAKEVKLDGFKVYNTLSDSSVYKKDDEDSPSFLEVRDLQFGTVVDASKYGTDGRKVYAVGEQVYKDLTNDGTVASAMITVNDQFSAADQKALYENGPKNEVYLAKNASLTLSFETAREVQLGLKGVNGNTTCSITKIGTKEVSTTDMFYTIKNKGVEGVQTITIQNTGDHILSVTKLKVCDDPNALQPLSVDSVVSALYAAGLKDPEQPTATPTPTVTATAAPTQKPVQQIKLATPKLGKVVSAGCNALKLNWSKVNGANGYRVYVKVNGQWKALGNTKSTTYVHKKLETGKSYTYTVKSYKNTKSGTVWSSYDKKGITGKAALSAPSLRKAKRTSAKKATLSWKKVNGASGYVVYRKTNNGRWQIVKKITKRNITSFTDKKLSKGKKYTYTVRAYRTVGKKNIYSGYNKKGLKVK
ncbi:Beta-N-acetylhexosaminidase precursor [uncultured Ruminococcus sp.]|uniref:family 20 glycosylhydrolase n=1 Tax=Blautia obeum TaxID=40520 RepID=UPI00082261B6|nr:family 20 glycosylhydrolase [Blautia obeum]SCH42469.1 Beta-N-acetylhexosaminidase precursor [uncultured Ruminococcus sp.]